MNNKQTLYINQIYEQMEQYIIIGLTGRCGSGCSTTREMLCNDTTYNPSDILSNIHMTEPNNENRDLQTILHYASYNPISFDSIRVRDILTSFILENSDNFFEIISDLYKEKNYSALKIKEDFYQYFSAEYLRNTPNKFETITDMAINIWSKIKTDNVYHFIEEINKESYDFLFQTIPQISEIIRSFLINQISPDSYTLVYQQVGNIIRTYGELIIPRESPIDTNQSIYAIMHRINQLLKILRRKDWILKNYELPPSNRSQPIRKSNVHVVIDSIKNVFEANYLKVRYRSFYLIALTLDDEARKGRLTLKNI